MAVERVCAIMARRIEPGFADRSNGLTGLNIIELTSSKRLSRICLIVKANLLIQDSTSFGGLSHRRRTPNHFSSMILADTRRRSDAVASQINRVCCGLGEVGIRGLDLGRCH